MGISLKMSATAMAGMLCAILGFVNFMVGVMLLDPIPGILSFIFGGIGLVIGLIVWKNERNRAKVIVSFSAITLVCSTLVAVMIIASGI